MAANAFRVTLNGVDQTGVAPNVETKVNFSHVVTDGPGAPVWNTTNNNAAPYTNFTASRIVVSCVVAVMAAFAEGGQLRARIRKNGVTVQEVAVPGNQIGPTSGLVSFADNVAGSTDTYDAAVYLERAIGDSSIIGDPIRSAIFGVAGPWAG